MTTTQSEAFEMMLAHHEELRQEVARRVDGVRLAVAAGFPHEPPVADLVVYVAGQVLTHARAEEATIYEVAAARAELAATAAAMTAEHQELASLLEDLSRSSGGDEAAAAAAAIGSLFDAHVTKENELLLPPLQADPSVELARLLAEMHRLTEEAQHAEGSDDVVGSGQDHAGPDLDAALWGLLHSAAGALAEAGHGDTACRLVARAWASLRAPRPDLAVRVTAALHRLVRMATAEPVALSAGRPGHGDAAAAVLDVRALAPAQRHEKIFATYAALGPGTGFILVNDHDPKPLRYQFEAEHEGDFTWDVLEAGPEAWRVRIGRPPAGTSGATVEGAGAPGETPGGEPELDVRRFAHGQRHDVIFATFDALAAGAAFVLVNDHDPKPLRYQFEAQHPDGYTWDYLEAGPAVWRVRIGRGAGAGR